ncbi:antibiotic biosynthesis monooxygenase [Paenibacillus methanolicus]|uniref:Heme oxygenase (Staphylobilin-producing) n=1 Tax=Paenibacillus methanolicus TaxID=582686 RepID=A0A5S5BSR5_9BACL|nr:antibiotic biosynthesis monooxygenase [Paenibacillus methanolicus]TYP69408.1 heme oxygenase (staphylobilin-producing) [Paenibacillus methanolicus]
MLIQTRQIMIEKGNAEQVVERFSKESPIEGMPGFIDRTVMVNKRAKDQEEVLVMIRWESEEAWKNWEKSDVHIQGHRQSAGQPKPEFVISTTVSMYEVKTVRGGTANV